MLTNIQPQDIT